MTSGPIRILQYDPLWPVVYGRERDLILRVLGEEIEEVWHVGSTSVPGLAAKPIIDILVAVKRRGPAEKYTPRLATLAYSHHSHEDDASRLYYWKGTPLAHTHHLHVVEYGSQEHRRHVRFPEYLRGHPETAAEYAELKRRLAAQHGDNMEAYTNGKSQFIEAVLRRAGRSRSSGSTSSP